MNLSLLIWVYFQKKSYKRITITDHPWRKKGREWMTKELVLDILIKELNGRKRMKIHKKHGNREVFIREYVPYQGRFYHLTFWFEDNNQTDYECETVIQLVKI